MSEISYNTANEISFQKSWIVSDYELYVKQLEKFRVDYPEDKWNHYVIVEKFREIYKCELIESPLLYN